MLTLIKASNGQGQQVSLPLQDNSSGLTLRNVEGLGPVKATIVSSTFAQLDGSEFQASSVENRNILITIGLEPYYGGKTVRELRDILYSTFMPKSRVTLQIYEDDIYTAFIDGYVESYETSLFSQDPEVVISIICTDPHFFASSVTTVNGMTTSGVDNMDISYAGSIETGYLLTLNVDRSVSKFIAYNRRADTQIRQFEFEDPLVSGDVVKILSVSKKKQITRLRAGVETPVLYGVSPFSSWLNLFPGVNQFRVWADGAPMPYTIVYTARYGGL